LEPDGFREDIKMSRNYYGERWAERRERIAQDEETACEAWLRQRAAWLERARNAGVHKPDGMDAAAANAGDQGLRTAVQRFLWAMVYFAAAYGM
jgi:pyridoxine/pyridoxamine 5'-phosphate oxidase